MPESGRVSDSGRLRFNRGIGGGVLLLAGAIALVLVSVRFSSDGSRLVAETLRGFGVVAALVAFFMFVLALLLRRQNRTAERLQSRDSVVATAFGGKSTTLRQELAANSGNFGTWRLPLYFCVAIECDRFSLWSDSSGQLACVGEVSWTDVDEVLPVPVRDGGRDFWGCRLNLRTRNDDRAVQARSLSILLRGGGPGGIFGLSEESTKKFVDIAESTRRQAQASAA